ncbi:MAG: hypothetical protein ACOX3U_05510 [Christensenellales bacterium]|jgi:exopolyphosphatase/guanosine-5'-triphosphate,3'-diphosphate pyrophosphatase
MKRAVIDIGSNSVRLMIEHNKDKLINTTQLAEGLSLTGRLNDDAIKRTADTVIDFYSRAQAYVDKIYVFATGAVRNAINGEDFINYLNKYDIEAEVLSGDIEAKAGFYGAYTGGNTAVIDIGGASTEIIVGENYSIKYSKSVDIGIVRLRDLCGQDIPMLAKYISNKLVEFGSVPVPDYAVSIGGTASTVAAILLGGYERKLVDNFRLTLNDIEKVLDLLVNTKDLSKIKGLPIMRRTVITGGVLLLKSIAEYIGLDGVTVSESDNMEGFLKILDLGLYRQ